MSSHFSLLAKTNVSKQQAKNSTTDDNSPNPTTTTATSDQQPNILSSLYDDSLYSHITFESHRNMNRFYLESHVVPVLVPGVMKLLTMLMKDEELINMYSNQSRAPQETISIQSVGSKRLNVPPLHFLAQYLMRYNPKHCSDLNNHPYVNKLNKYLNQNQHMVQEMKKMKRIWLKERFHREKERLKRNIRMGRIILKQNPDGSVVEEKTAALQSSEDASTSVHDGEQLNQHGGVSSHLSDSTDDEEDLDEMSYDDAFKRYKERLYRNKLKREQEERERAQREKEEAEHRAQQKEVKSTVSDHPAQTGKPSTKTNHRHGLRKSQDTGAVVQNDETSQMNRKHSTGDNNEDSDSGLQKDDASSMDTPLTTDNGPTEEEIRQEKELQERLRKEKLQLEKKRDLFLKKQKVYSFGISSMQDIDAFYKKMIQDLESLLPGDPIMHIATQENHAPIPPNDYDPNDATLKFTHTSDHVALMRGNTVHLPTNHGFPLLEHVWNHHRDVLHLKDPLSSDIIARYADTEEKQKHLQETASKGHIVSVALTNSRQDPCGIFTVEYAENDISLSEDDVSFIKKVAEALSLAQQSVHVEQSIQRVKAKARALLNHNKRVVFNQGMREMIGIIPNSFHAYAGELDMEREALVCVSEFDRSEYYAKEYISADSEEEYSPSSGGDSNNNTYEEPSIHRHIGQRLVSSPEGTFKAIKSGEPITLNDLEYLSDEEIFGEIRTSKRRAKGAVVIPLKHQDNGEVFGVISVELDQQTNGAASKQSNGKNSATPSGSVMTEESIYQLKKLSDAMSLSLHIIDTREKLKNLSLQAIEWIEGTCNITGAYFAMLRDDGDLQYVAAGKDSQDILGMKLPKGKGITYRCIENGEPVIVDDVQTISDKVHFFNESDNRRSGSFIAHPVKNQRGNVIGVLACNKFASSFDDSLLFTEEEKKNILIAMKTLQATANYDSLQDEKEELAGDTLQLAIDKEIEQAKEGKQLKKQDITKTKFLKRMLLKSRREFRNLHQDAFSSLAAASTSDSAKAQLDKSPSSQPPSENTYRSIRALLFLSGYTSDQLGAWQKCASILQNESNQILKRVEEMDPTSSMETSFKFKLARHILSHLSYQTMIKSSRRTALLMFSYCQICLGLRDEADVLRNQLRQMRGADIIVSDEDADQELLKAEDEIIYKRK